MLSTLLGFRGKSIFKQHSMWAVIRISYMSIRWDGELFLSHLFIYVDLAIYIFKSS